MTDSIGNTTMVIPMYGDWGGGGNTYCQNSTYILAKICYYKICYYIINLILIKISIKKIPNYQPPHKPKDAITMSNYHPQFSMTFDREILCRSH